MTINWKKSAFVIADIALAAYLLLAITAFNMPDDQEDVCAKVEIMISDDADDGFLGDGEIVEQLKRAKLYPQGLRMSQIDVRKIEEALRQNPFVEKAECYKTQGAQVHITLEQRLPVVRVKADNGEDYYLDSHGAVMPNTHYASDLVIATGSISQKYAKKVLARIGNYVVKTPFWQSQIEQFNVLPDGSLEMVPRVGDHVVYFGRPTNMQQKLERLEKFYRYGLSVAGWNKYSYISMEFENQIICKKKRKL